MIHFVNFRFFILQPFCKPISLHKLALITRSLKVSSDGVSIATLTVNVFTWSSNHPWMTHYATMIQSCHDTPLQSLQPFAKEWRAIYKSTGINKFQYCTVNWVAFVDIVTNLVEYRLCFKLYTYFIKKIFWLQCKVYHNVSATGKCPETYTYSPLSDTCFRLITNGATWQEADRSCRNDGEFLMTFPTAASSEWYRNKSTEMALVNSGKCKKFNMILRILNYIKSSIV